MTTLRVHIFPFLMVIIGFTTPFLLRGQTPSVPANVVAIGYDSHVELTWKAVANVQNYQIWRSTNGGVKFDSLKTVRDTMLIDFARSLGTNMSLLYKVKAVGTAGAVSDFSTDRKSVV